MKSLIIAFALLSTFTGFSQYSYEFEVEGIANDTVYLANYFGGKLYYNDTATVDEKGKFIFEGEGSKKGGIYAVILPDGKTYFEVAINEPSFSAKTKKDNPEQHLSFNGSKENAAFYGYKNFIVKKRMEGAQLQESLKKAESDDEKVEIREKINAINDEVKAYQERFFDKNEDLFVAKVMKMAIEPEMPDDLDQADSSATFRYYKKHFFDNVDMNDDRLLRTPILNGKIKTYLEKLTAQVPDSICAAARHMTNMTSEDSEIYKFIVQFTTTTYEKSKVMGMDAVFVCMAEAYYLQDKAWWLDSSKIANIEERYGVLKNLTLGTKAENIILPNENGEWKSLHEIDSEFTLLYFWDPNCGHCKKETPKLQEFYEEWKSKGLEIYAVCTEFETKDWKKYIENKGLTFINVSDTPEINKNAWDYINAGKTTLNSLNFRDYWDIYSTPQFYLLDKDKKIIAKRLATEQLGDFIEKHRKLTSSK